MTKWDRNSLYRLRSGLPSLPLLVIWLVAILGFAAYLFANASYVAGAIYAAVAVPLGFLGTWRYWNSS